MSHIEPRGISSDELAVLEAALVRAPTAATPRVSSGVLKGLTVHSKCDCGCAGVGFLPEGTMANTDTKLIADGLGLSQENKQLGIIVYGSPGQIVELELHWPYTDGAPLPRPETILRWEDGTTIKESGNDAQL